MSNLSFFLFVLGWPEGLWSSRVPALTKETAKKSREKKRQRDEAAEAKRLEREEAKRLKKEQKEALKAGAKKIASPAGAVPAAPAEVTRKKVLQIAAGDLQAVPDMQEANYMALSQGDRVGLVPAPFLIQDCQKLVAELRALSRVQAQIAMFKGQFTSSSHVKATGRAQLPITAADQIDEVGSIFKKMDPTGVAWPKNLPAGHELTSLTQPSIYGFTSSMNYVGGEDKWVGQLRLQLAGERYLVMAKYSEVASKLDVKKRTLGEVAKVFSDLDAESARAAGLQLWQVKQKGETVLYIPPGWLFAEHVVSTDVVCGVKMACGHKQTLDSFNVILKDKQATDAAGAMLKTMQAYSDFLLKEDS